MKENRFEHHDYEWEVLHIWQISRQTQLEKKKGTVEEGKMTPSSSGNTFLPFTSKTFISGRVIHSKRLAIHLQLHDSLASFWFKFEFVSFGNLK